MAKTVADQFADTLAAAGVRRIFGIAGDSLNGLTDSDRSRADESVALADNSNELTALSSEWSMANIMHRNGKFARTRVERNREA
jgi:hypothetical protein